MPTHAGAGSRCVYVCHRQAGSDRRLWVAPRAERGHDVLLEEEPSVRGRGCDPRAARSPATCEREPRHRAGARAAQRAAGRRARRPHRRDGDAAVDARPGVEPRARARARRRLDRPGHAGAARGHDAGRDARARGLAERGACDGGRADAGGRAGDLSGTRGAQRGGRPRAVERHPRHHDGGPGRGRHERRGRAAGQQVAQGLLPRADLPAARFPRDDREHDAGDAARDARHGVRRRREHERRALHVARAGEERAGTGFLGSGLPARRAGLPAGRHLRAERRLGHCGGRRQARLGQRSLRGARAGARARPQPRPRARRRPRLHERRGCGSHGRLLLGRHARVRRPVRRDGQEQRRRRGLGGAPDEHGAQARAEPAAADGRQGGRHPGHLPDRTHGDADGLGRASAPAKAGRRQLLRRVPAADRLLRQPGARHHRRAHPHRIAADLHEPVQPERRHRSDRHAPDDRRERVAVVGCGAEPGSGVQRSTARHHDPEPRSGRGQREPADHAAARCGAAECADGPVGRRERYDRVPAVDRGHR